MGNAILKRMASGIPGDLSRRGQSLVEPVQLDTTNVFPGYGVPGKFSGGKFMPIALNDLASAVVGFLVRPFPVQTSNSAGTGISPSIIGDAMRRGYMTVVNNAGAPAINGQVYVRVSNPSGGKPIGGIEAAAENIPVAVAGGNTGNGVVSALTADNTAAIGAHKVTFLTATTYRVETPTGVRLKDGATGVAYSAGGVGFTITAGGTAFVANDSFTITVTPGTVAIPRCVFKAAADASGNVEIEYAVGQ